MFKWIFLFFIFLSLGLNAQEDKDFMIIGKKTFSLADFKSEYERNMPNASYSKESVTHYLRNFKILQAKIIRSWELRLDTASFVRSSLSSYADGIISKEMKDEQIEGNGSLLIGQIFLPLGQHASVAEERSLRQRIDSARAAIESGSDFFDVANHVVPEGKNLCFISRDEMLSEVENVAFALEEGQMSAAFLATDGFHLIKRMPENYAKQRGKEVLVHSDIPSQTDIERARQELMLEELCRRCVLDRSQSEIAKSKYFQEHQKDYQWHVPHFKGAVYHCKDNATRKQVDALLKKYPVSQWQKVIDGPKFDKLRDKVVFDRIGLYAKGDNPYLDMQRFSGPKVRTKEGYPFYGSTGHLLKKYPESYMDVSEEVTLDYTKSRIGKWEESLLQLYPIFVSDKMLRQLYE